MGLFRKVHKIILLRTFPDSESNKWNLTLASKPYFFFYKGEVVKGERNKNITQVIS